VLADVASTYSLLLNNICRPAHSDLDETFRFQCYEDAPKQRGLTGKGLRLLMPLASVAGGGGMTALQGRTSQWECQNAMQLELRLRNAQYEKRHAVELFDESAFE